MNKKITGIALVVIITMITGVAIANVYSPTSDVVLLHCDVENQAVPMRCDHEDQHVPMLGDRNSCLNPFFQT